MNEADTLTEQRRLDEQRRLEEQRRQTDTTEAARREHQQIIEDDERHALERNPARAPRLVATDARVVGTSRREPSIGDPSGDADDAAPVDQADLGANGTNRHFRDRVAVGGPFALLFFALVLAGAGYLGWKFYSSRQTPAAPVTATATDAPLPTTVPAPPARPDQRTQPVDPVAPVTTPAGARASGDLANGSVPVDPAGLPYPAPTHEAITPPSDEAVAAKALAFANEQRVESLSARLDRLESMLVAAQERVAKVEQAALAASQPPAAPVLVRAAPAPESPKPARVARPAPAPIGKGQLLAIDMWNGVPSVVVGTGVPGDKRVRVLKRGDSYNGVSLLNVDPSAKTATFGVSGGRTVTLSVNEGG